jgi:hypothetical protein
VPIEERLLEEKRHHTGTSHSRICIDMISIARRKLLMLSGVLVLCGLMHDVPPALDQSGPRLRLPFAYARRRSFASTICLS